MHLRNICSQILIKQMCEFASTLLARTNSVQISCSKFGIHLLNLQTWVNPFFRPVELLKLCLNVNLDISDEQTKQVEKDTRSQAKRSGFFKHRAGRIGASASGVAFHSNLAQPPQSCIKSVCYLNVYKLNTKAIKHGCRYEDLQLKHMR